LPFVRDNCCGARLRPSPRVGVPLIGTFVGTPAMAVAESFPNWLNNDPRKAHAAVAVSALLQ